MAQRLSSLADRDAECEWPEVLKARSLERVGREAARSYESESSRKNLSIFPYVSRRSRTIAFKSEPYGSVL